MKIIYTKHALKKFGDLSKHGVQVSKHRIQSILKNPSLIDTISNHPNTIATGRLDKNHVLRVVYRAENDKILIITFYPGGKERYL